MIYGIAVNSLNAPRHTGVERYLAELLREMLRLPLPQGDTVRLYAAKIPQGFEQLPAGWEWRILPQGKGWTHLRLSWELLRNPPDVFFNPTHELPLYVAKKTKIAFTVHDLAFRRVPSVYAPGADRRQKWAIARAVKKSAKLLAVSQTTKRDLMEIYRVPEQKIAVTALGVRAEKFAEEESRMFDVLQKYRQAPGRYLLYVGRLEEKKNIVTLVRAFAELKRTLGNGHPLTLVLAGSFGFGKERIVRAMQNVSDIQVLGYIPDADLPSLMKGARALCFASHYEGFGLPVLEAFAAGTPVLASDIPAFREVAGEGALFAGTNDITAWKRNMERMIFDEAARKELSEKGRTRVQEFSWEKTAQATWDALRVM